MRALSLSLSLSFFVGTVRQATVLEAPKVVETSRCQSSQLFNTNFARTAKVLLPWPYLTKHLFFIENPLTKHLFSPHLGKLFQAAGHPGASDFQHPTPHPRGPPRRRFRHRRRPCPRAPRRTRPGERRTRRRVGGERTLCWVECQVAGRSLANGHRRWERCWQAPLKSWPRGWQYATVCLFVEANGPSKGPCRFRACNAMKLHLFVIPTELRPSGAQDFGPSKWLPSGGGSSGDMMPPSSV